MRSSNHERLVDLLADSLAEHLLVEEEKVRNTPTTSAEGYQEQEKLPLPRILMDQARQEIRRRLLLLHDEDSSKSNEECEVILQNAMKKAALQSSQKKTSRATTVQQPSKPTSISLFSTSSVVSNPFSGGGSLLSLSDTTFITWNKVEQIEGLGAKLALLQKLEYIDDILPDWEASVRPFLQAALLPQQQQQQQQERRGFVDLHRAWFHKTRSSSSSNPEYRSLQIDLVENLVQAVDEQCKANDNNNNDDATNWDNVTVLCARHCIDMFHDWVDRGGINSDGSRIHAIGSSIWNNWCFHKQLQATVLQHSLPHVSWFVKWVALLTPTQVLTLVCSSSVTTAATTTTTTEGGGGAKGETALSHLYCRLIASIELLSRSQTSITLPGGGSADTIEENDDDDVYNHVLFLLSALHSILASTRVSRFPWHLLTQEPQLQAQEPRHQSGQDSSMVWSSSSKATADVQLQVLDFYVQFTKVTLSLLRQSPRARPEHADGENVAFLLQNHQASTLRMCADAVDTMLCGCQYVDAIGNNNNNNNVGSSARRIFEVMIDKVTSFVVHVKTLNDESQQPQQRPSWCPEARDLVLELYGSILDRFNPKV